MSLRQYPDQRAAAAFCATSRRRSGVWLAGRALALLARHAGGWDCLLRSASTCSLSLGTSSVAMSTTSLASCARSLGLLGSAMVLFPCERLLRGVGIARDIVYLPKGALLRQLGLGVLRRHRNTQQSIVLRGFSQFLPRGGRAGLASRQPRQCSPVGRGWQSAANAISN